MPLLEVLQQILLRRFSRALQLLFRQIISDVPTLVVVLKATSSYIDLIVERISW